MPSPPAINAADRRISATPPIRGQVDPRFTVVREAFERNFRAEEEVGAAVCVRVDGRTVVDLWGGTADPEKGTAWQRDTLVNAYSTGKGVLSTLVLCLAERGVIDLDAPVAALWPEFAAAGKGDVSLATLLSHRAGLPAIREILPDDAMLDWHRVCEALAAQRPYWEPGTRHGYHVNTFGWLVGEVVRRATGKRVGEALAEWVTGPLDADYSWGLPRSQHHRCARTLAPGADALLSAEQLELAFPPTGDTEHDAMIQHCYFNPAGGSGMGYVNTEGWRLAEIPSTNGHGNARALARIYGALLTGGLGVGTELLARACRIASDGEDVVLGRPSRFGLGFQLPQPTRPIGPNAETFGHYGYGGSLGFADPAARVAFGFVTNRPGERWQTPRTQNLIDAVYDALEAR